MAGAGRKETAGEEKPEYDPNCYLCPGNDLAGDASNSEYISTFSFQNDFSALLPDTSNEEVNDSDLLISKGECGMCKVICFSPHHDLTLPEMELSQVNDVVVLWVDEYRELGKKDFINYVQIFENKGEVIGCSNPHPHGQIWTQETIPEELAKELKRKERLIVENDHFAVVVPFWAFETLVS